MLKIYELKQQIGQKKFHFLALDADLALATSRALLLLATSSFLGNPFIQKIGLIKNLM